MVSVSEEGLVSLQAVSGAGVRYALQLQLCHPVNSKARAGPRPRRAAPPLTRRGQESKIAATPRAISLLVLKTASGPYWGKLTPGKAPHYVKVDWSKYKDEDELEEGAAGALSAEAPWAQPCAHPASRAQTPGGST